ncbi:MAG: addiction module antitoxin [Thermodesulfobacteriota bacterium]
MKKLTITVSEDVYEGLYKKVGAGKISSFINNLARPYVVDNEIVNGYKEMAEDYEREDNAKEWAENLVGDLKSETW